jgi:hypothetical protein
LNAEASRNMKLTSMTALTFQDERLLLKLAAKPNMPDTFSTFDASHEERSLLNKEAWVNIWSIVSAVDTFHKDRLLLNTEGSSEPNAERLYKRSLSHFPHPILNIPVIVSALDMFHDERSLLKTEALLNMCEKSLTFPTSHCDRRTLQAGTFQASSQPWTHSMTRDKKTYHQSLEHSQHPTMIGLG